MPASFLSDLNVINLCASIPLAQDLLLDKAFCTLLPGEYSKFEATCEEVERGKRQLWELEEEVFASLPKQTRIDSYWQATEKISQIVERKNEASSSLRLCDTAASYKDCSQGIMSRDCLQIVL